MPDQRLIDLAHQYLDNTLAADEAQLLDHALRTDADFCRWFAELHRREVALHGAIHLGQKVLTLQQSASARIPRTRARAARPHGGLLRAWAAALVMVGILLAATWVSVRSTNANGGSGAVTVVHAVRGFVVGDGRALTDGDHLRVGDLIQVGADAKIRFDDRDALIDIVADSTLTIGDQGPELAHGALMISVEKQPPGTVFRVVTRHATITVIGTRFTVHADEQETRLSVAHGVVEMQTPRWTERFHAGQTASSLATGLPPTSIAASQPAASVLSARLLDLATGQPVPGMDPLKPGALVPLNLFQAQRIAALEVLAPAEVMAVTIQVTGPSVGSDRKPLQRTRPFSYPNERGGKIDRTWELKPGVYQIQVQGFRDDQGTQSVGAALTLHFTVTAPE